MFLEHALTRGWMNDFAARLKHLWSSAPGILLGVAIHHVHTDFGLRLADYEIEERALTVAGLPAELKLVDEDHREIGVLELSGKSSYRMSCRRTNRWTATRAECAFLLSEDMQDGGRFAGVTVLNPFVGATLPEPVAALLR